MSHICEQHREESRRTKNTLASEVATTDRSRRTFRMVRAAAAIVVALALGECLATNDAMAASATASAQILSLGLVTVEGIPNTLQITPRDMRRGYIDVPLKITTTFEGGYLLSTEVVGDAFSTSEAVGGLIACSDCRAGTHRFHLGTGTPPANSRVKVLFTVNNY